MHRILLGMAAAAALTLGATTDAKAQGISIGFSTGGYGGWGGHVVSGSRYGYAPRYGYSPRYGASVFRAPIHHGYGYRGYPRGVSRRQVYANPHVTRRYATPRYRVCPRTGRYIPY